MRMLKNSRTVRHDLKQIEALLNRVKETIGKQEGDIITLAGALGVHQAKVTWNENYRNETNNATTWNTTNAKNAFHTGSATGRALVTHTKTTKENTGPGRPSTTMNGLRNLLSGGGIYDASAVAYKLSISKPYARVLLGSATKKGYARRVAAGKYTAKN